MNPTNHKVIIYAELNGGKDITDKELRLIVKDLERRGFKGYSERIEGSRYDILNKLARTLGLAKDIAGKAWDSLDELG